jgi:signal transduction histidine kinase
MEDNGVGFDPQHVQSEGLGLKHIRQRAELIGASILIQSQKGEGTKVTLTLSEFPEEIPIED